jgi:peptide-methionine (R)-S-oxide reductase
MTKQINKKLTDLQKEVMFRSGTEAPFSGEFYLKKDEGVFHCANCDNPIFKTDDQFDSDCGWPSFESPISKGAVTYHEDKSHGMVRTEVLCGNCGAHLGHVFDETNRMRYCINSAVLDLKK